MLASAVWLSVGMSIRSLCRVTRPVVPLLLTGHVDCICQRGREQSISFMGLQETSKINSGDSVVEHEPLLIHLLLEDSCRRGLILTASLSTGLLYKERAPSIIPRVCQSNYD